jgi:hypothetical protein
MSQWKDFKNELSTTQLNAKWSTNKSNNQWCNSNMFNNQFNTNKPLLINNPWSNKPFINNPQSPTNLRYTNSHRLCNHHQ